MNHWYALRVKSNFEKTVQTALQHRGFEEFLPVYRMESRWSDRIKTVERPLFPGYVFASFDASRRLPLLMIPGVVHILGDSAGPIAVDDVELYAVRRSVESGLSVTPWPYLCAGDAIEVEEGALAGLRGILLRTKDYLRVVVSLTLLQRSISVELDRNAVRPAEVNLKRRFSYTARPRTEQLAAAGGIR